MSSPRNFWVPAGESDRKSAFWPLPPAGKFRVISCLFSVKPATVIAVLTLIFPPGASEVGPVRISLVPGTGGTGIPLMVTVSELDHWFAVVLSMHPVVRASISPKLAVFSQLVPAASELAGRAAAPRAVLAPHAMK